MLFLRVVVGVLFLFSPLFVEGQSCSDGLFLSFLNEELPLQLPLISLSLLFSLFFLSFFSLFSLFFLSSFSFLFPLLSLSLSFFF